MVGEGRVERGGRLGGGGAEERLNKGMEDRSVAGKWKILLEEWSWCFSLR